MTQIGICKFCEKEKELIRSHIIPKCFYQMKTWGDMASIDVKENRVIKKNQDGLKEYLLCKECDNQLGIFDNHANKLLFHIVPKHEYKIFSDVGKTYLIQKTDFNYDKLRKFFISLVWRASICKTKSFRLGNYENIALKILKNEIPDDENLFLPLIYRKNTNTSVDYITGLFSDNIFGQKNPRFRFPNYEVVVIIDTRKNNTNNMIFYKRMFTENEIVIIELSTKTYLDYHLISNMINIQKKYKKKEGL